MLLNSDNPTVANTSINSHNFNFKKTLFSYLKHWKWFVLSLLLCLGLAYLYLRYTTPKYEAYAKIMLLEDKDAASALMFQDMTLFSEREEAKMEDEIEVIRSRNFLNKIVKDLNLNVKIYNQGRINDSEFYKNAPISINFIASDSLVHNTSFGFFIEVLSDAQFNYKIYTDDVPVKTSFGENIPTAFGGMIITPKMANIKNYIGNEFYVAISPVVSISNYLRDAITIQPIGKSSKVLSISYVDPVPRKAIDIINTLIEEYNRSAMDMKNSHSRKTANFIDKRVELIAQDLVSVDDSIVRFKTGNKVTDVASEAGQFLSISTQNEQVLDQNKTELRILNYMNESLNSANGFQHIPSNLGLGDPTISELSTRYNELLNRREELAKSAGNKNLALVNLDESLDNIRQNLRTTVNNSIFSSRIRIENLESQASKVNSKIYSVPGQESKLRSIERKQGIKESLYLYLLEKREEAAISLASTTPNIKVVDEAFSTGAPVSPNKKTVFAAALFLGLFIPFSILYVKDLLDTKIHNKEDVEAQLKNITVLGEIPRLKGKELNKLVQKNDTSLLSESMRIVRTNLDFVRHGRHVKDYNNIIFVTSTINGEGKSLFSLNLALTLVNTNKRVLLIGADIRNPKQIIDKFKVVNGNKNNLGLTDFLSDDAVAVEETILTHNIKGINVEVLPSGKIPPNPAELLMSDRMKSLFDNVSERYDYIIVDTAPCMLVTDTLLFSQYAGHSVYLTRADYTEKSILNFAKDLHDNNKLKGMMVVVNDVDQANFGYGAKYGYYGAKRKKGIFGYWR